MKINEHPDFKPLSAHPVKLNEAAAVNFLTKPSKKRYEASEESKLQVMCCFWVPSKIGREEHPGTSAWAGIQLIGSIANLHFLSELKRLLLYSAS